MTSGWHIRGLRGKFSADRRWHRSRRRQCSANGPGDGRDAGPSNVLKIPPEKLQELKERASIEEVVGRYVDLRRSGRQYKACCPFHAEKTPSFYVNPERRSYKCFGCGVYGDVIEFVSQIEGTSFIETVQGLAEQFGVSLPISAPDAARAGERTERDQMLRVNACAAELFRRILERDDVAKAARAYAQTREITGEVAESFRIGYAPAPEEAGWDTLVRELTRQGQPLDVATKLGLIARSERSGTYYDKFRGRLMFPVIRPGGAVLGFSGRVLPEWSQGHDGEPVPKYTNSPESTLYRKSKTIFGLHAAGPHIRRQSRVILVEGNVDVVSMHRLGHPETVAPLGTALTEEQCQILSRFTRQVVICFDGDRAGTKATAKAIPMLLEAGLEPRVVALSEGEDPDSVDPARLGTLLERPVPGVLWYVRKLVAAGAKDSPEARVRAVRRVIPLLRRIPDLEIRSEYVSLAANLLDVPVERLSSDAGTEAPRRRSQPVRVVRDSAAMRPLPPLPRGQAMLTALLVDLPMVSGGAQREEVLSHIDDGRLRPIVEEILEGARRGEQSGVGELLDLIDERARKQVYDAVFAGRYVDEENPEAVLETGLALCRLRVLEREIRELDKRSADAKRQGQDELVRDFQLQKIELRRRQSDLKRSLAKQAPN